MSAHVLMNLLKELRLVENLISFSQQVIFKNTGAHILDSICHITIK